MPRALHRPGVVDFPTKKDNKSLVNIRYPKEYPETRFSSQTKLPPDERLPWLGPPKYKNKTWKKYAYFPSNFAVSHGKTCDS